MNTENSITENIIFIFALLLGRFPLWVLLGLYLVMGRLSLGAFVAFYLAAVLAKGWLYSYEYRKGLAVSSIRSLWKYVLKPLCYLFILEISLFGIIYAVFWGSRTDWWILLMAFGFFTLACAASIFITGKNPLPLNTFIPRTRPLKILLVLLWVYALLGPDGLFMAELTVFVIYTIEFLATFRYRSGETTAEGSW